MIQDWLLAAAHLMTMTLAASAVLVRGSLAMRVGTTGDPRPVQRAHWLWLGALAVVILTGVLRLVGPGKGTAYYLHQPFFHLKLTLVALLLALEIWPTLTVVRWDKGAVGSPRTARVIGILSHTQATLLLLVILAATAMARGITPAALAHG